jgi:hypothetical protein
MRVSSLLSFVLITVASCGAPKHVSEEPPTPVDSLADAASDEFEFNATQDPSQPDGIFLPATLDEALHELDRGMSSGFKRAFREAEENPVGRFHGDFGMWMRNCWGLWRGSALSEYFNALGIWHPDDMSGIILTSYWRRVRGVPIDLDGQVAGCKAYWAAAEAQQ